MVAVVSFRAVMAPVRLRFLLPLLVLLTACMDTSDDAALAKTAKRVFGTIPEPKQRDSAALVKLGQHLYHSTALSQNGTQSCASCHPVEGDAPGADNKPTSPGAMGSQGRRNTPTVLNASLHVAQFWDGRAKTLEEQAQGPIVNPVEMAMPNAVAVAQRLRTAPNIDRALFAKAFPNDPNPYTIEHAARAIAAFERTLQTSDRFDAFMEGDTRALTAHEKEGLRRFMALGCTSCHNGPLVGARIYQKIGIVRPWPSESDLGRYEVTKNDGDRFVFKVPSLRNVALTSPYFHDGSVQTLPEAVDRMAYHQLGMEIRRKDRDAIVAFLKAMSRG